MSFCPHCGATTTPAMAFCASCGRTLAPAAPPPGTQPPVAGGAPPTAFPPPSAAPFGAPAAAAATGPRGRVREPGIAVLLAIVTLGIYGLYYWWVVSKEVDAYAGRPDHSHKLIKIGTILSIVAGIAGVFLAISMFATIFSAAIAAEGDPEDVSEEAILAAVFGMIGMFVLVGVVSFAGAILRLIGKWRLWQMLEEDERRRAHPSPLSAGLMIGLTIGAWVVGIIPFVGILAIALPLVVLYMTADHLNQAWQAPA